MDIVEKARLQVKGGGYEDAQRWLVRLYGDNKRSTVSRWAARLHQSRCQGFQPKQSFYKAPLADLLTHLLTSTHSSLTLTPHPAPRPTHPHPPPTPTHSLTHALTHALTRSLTHTHSPPLFLV